MWVEGDIQILAMGLPRFKNMGEPRLVLTIEDDEPDHTGMFVLTIEDDAPEKRGPYVLTIEDEEPEEDWVKLGTFSVDSKDSYTIDTFVGGSYSGYAGHITTKYNRVKVVGGRTAWLDGTADYPPDGGWRAFINVITQIDYARIGPFPSFAYNQEAALNAFHGATAELSVGSDHLVYWGIRDIANYRNKGVMTFEIWGINV